MGRNKKNKAEIDRAISKIIANIKGSEGENAPAIISHLFSREWHERELMDLAYGPPASKLKLKSLCDSAKSFLRLPPSGFPPPISSQFSPRISENSFLVSAAATPSLISGSVSGSHSNLSSWPSSSSSSGLDGVLGLTPSGFPPPFSSQSSPRISENRFLESAAATPSLTSGTFSGSHSNLSSWPSYSSSSSGVDGVLSLPPSGFPWPFSSQFLPRISENCFLVSGASTPSLTSGTVSGSHSNLSSWPSSSSSSGVGGNFSLWESKDPFRVYVKSGDANLQKSSLGFQETGLVDKLGSTSGSGTERVGNVSSCTKSIQELKITKEAEKKNESLFSEDDFPSLKDTGKIVALRRGHRHQLDIQNLKRRARQETAAPPEIAAPPDTAAPDNLPGSSKISDEAHKNESEKEKSTTVDDSSENKEETRGMSESARQETTVPLDTAVPDNLPGSPKIFDETHQEESEKEKSTPVDNSGENKKKQVV